MSISLLAGCGGSERLPAAAPFVPKNTINWMCTSSPGGGSDIYTRKIIDIMTS